MKNKIISLLFLVLNTAIALVCIYFFMVVSAKYFLSGGDFKKAEKLFSFTGNVPGKVITLIRSQKWDDARKIALKGSDEVQGIMAWAEQDYVRAAKLLKEGGSKAEYYAVANYLSGQEDEGTPIPPIVKGQMSLVQNHYADAAKTFLDIRHLGGLAALFLKLDQMPSAIVYLHKTGEFQAGILARLLQHMENVDDQKLNPQQMGTEVRLWIDCLRGTPERARKTITTTSSTVALPMIDTLLGTPEKALEHPAGAATFDQLLLWRTRPSRQKEFDEVISRNPSLKPFHIVPPTILEPMQETKVITYFGIALAILILVFIAALIQLFKKYQASLIVHRHKELEKMDALSISKYQSSQAQAKRDKTELNVSSFVTLNIQVEVLDVAFAKLGLRVDPKKLAEQLEQAKIPNVSYKIYTISNSYGLNVKMQSIDAKELPKLKSHGAVVLVLKGDLIALLKRADGKNAYLQFSTKDSRKVPYPALKLSWEGSIITLDKV